MSKAHVCPGHYAAVATTGFFPIDELCDLRGIGSRLETGEMPEMLERYRMPGIDIVRVDKNAPQVESLWYRGR